jgi:hypothetical protein
MELKPTSNLTGSRFLYDAAEYVRDLLIFQGWGTAPGVEQAIPNFDFRDTGLFGPGHFRYDSENDHSLCPAGQRLRLRNEDRHIAFHLHLQRLGQTYLLL